MKIKIKRKPSTTAAPLPRGITHLPLKDVPLPLDRPAWPPVPPEGKQILFPSVGEIRDMPAESLGLWMTIASEMSRALRLEQLRQRALKEGKTDLARVEGQTRDAALATCYERYSDYIPF